MSEWKREAPTLYRILTAVATPKAATELSEDRLPPACVAGSIQLRSCSQHYVCSTSSHRVTFVPWKCERAGNQIADVHACTMLRYNALHVCHCLCHLQTHTRLNHLQITVINSNFEQDGGVWCKFDEKVLEWVNILSKKLENDEYELHT